MLAALLLVAAAALQDSPQDPLPALDLVPRAGSGETVLVALPDASEAGTAVAELLEDLAPLDEPLELRRHVLAAGSAGAARQRAAWKIGAGPRIAILVAGETEVVAYGPEEFSAAFLARVVRPRLRATLRPEGLRFVEGRAGVDVLVAFEAMESVGETSRLEVVARWIGPDLALRHADYPVSANCDVPAGLTLALPGVAPGPGPAAAPRPVPDLFLFAGATGATPPPVTRELTIRGGVYDAWTLVVAAGSTVRFVNRDRCSHALHVYARRNLSMNRSLAPKARAEQVYERPEIVRVADDLHPWMEAWIVVTDSPHFAATDAEGRAALEAPPVGVSGLRLWHPDSRIPGTRLPLEVLPGDDLRVRVWMFAR